MRGTKRALAFVIAVGCGGGPGGDGIDGQQPDASRVPDARTGPTYAAGDPIALGADLGNDEDPAVLVARDGSLYVAWFSEGAGFDILISRTTDGLTWSTPVHVSEGAAKDFAPTLYEDNDGYIHAVWFRWDAGAPPGHLIHNRTGNRFDGLSWFPAAANEVTPIGAWDDWVPSIAGDATGAMTVAFARNTCPPPDECYGIYTTSSTSPVGDFWQTPAPVALANASEEHHLPSLAQAADGLHLAWDPFDRDATSPYEGLSSGSYIATARFDGVGWTDSGDLTVRDDASIALFPALFTDHDGALHALWLAADASITQNVEVPLSAPGGTPRPIPALAGYSAKLAATPTPNIYLGAWVEGPGDQRDVMIQLLTLD